MSNQSTRCWAEIDLSAIKHNLQLLQKYGPKIMAVVKANAYGHGVDIVVPALRGLGIKHYAVATVDEAAEIRDLTGMLDVSVYLMAAVLSDDAERVADLNLTPFASDTDFVKDVAHVARLKGKTVAVHIEVDTGIGRAGIPPSALLGTLLLWNSFEGVRVTGICTHFTAADSADPADCAGQLALFEEALSSLPPELLVGLSIHAANSPAALRMPQAVTGLFRPGLLLYGIAPSPQLAVNFPFEPVLSLKARVLLARRLPQGSDISYSRTYTLPDDADIATIGIGYGDGYPRRLSNIGHVLLADGTSAPIRGRVCMDQLCIEVPEFANCSSGDTVTLIGKVDEDEISVSEIADVIGATPHEITTCLTGRVRRVTTGGTTW